MPMAMTVIIALATAFVLSLTFVPAMVAIAVTGRVQEKENLFVRGLKALYQPALARAIRSPVPVIAGAVLLFAGAVAVVPASWSGVHADPRREEHRHGGQADSEHVAFAVAVHAASQRDYGWPFSAGRLRLLAYRHSRPRRRSDAAERVRHVHHLEAARSSGPIRTCPKDDLIQRTGYRSIETAGQQDRLLTANSDAFQRADRRGAGGFGGQGLRRRFRPDAACGRSNRFHPSGGGRRQERQDRGGGGPAVPGHQDRQGRDCAPRLEPFGRSGCHRHRHRRTRSRPGVRRRPPLPDHRAAARCGAQRCRYVGKFAGDAAASRRRDRIADHPIASARDLQLLGRTQSDQSGEWQAPRRRDRRSARARHRLSG